MHNKLTVITSFDKKYILVTLISLLEFHNSENCNVHSNVER